MKTVFLILNYKTYNDTIKISRHLLSDNICDRGIVIVDNASPNESFERLSSEFNNVPNVCVVSSGENGGYAKGNNFGLRYIKKFSPEYVCIINNDVYFSMSLIEKLESIYRELANVAFISPVQYNLNSQTPLSFIDLRHIPTLFDDFKTISGIGSMSKHIYTQNCEYKDFQEVAIIPGAFLFVNYSVFESLGFFDERTFLFCEERFIAKKAKDAGLRSFVLLNERYIHAHSVTINSETSKARQRKMLFEGKLLYTRIHRTFPLMKITLLYIAYLINKILLTLKSYIKK